MFKECIKSLFKSLTRVSKFPLFFVLLASSCGTFKVREKNANEVSSIKSVALVAMSVEEPIPKEIAFDLGSGKLEGEAGMGRFQEKSQHVEAMFQDLNRNLALRMKWKTLDKTSLTSNAGYRSAFDETMKGWQNKMPPGEGRTQFVVSDIMDYDAIRIMGPKGRDKLIDALKVDAIFVAKVDVRLGGTSIMGIGPRRPRSALSFQVYKKGFETPVWFDGQVLGKEMGSVGSTALWDQKKLQEYGMESAKDAFSQIDKVRE